MEHRFKDDIPLQIARRKILAGIGAADSCLHPSHQRISCGTAPPGRPLND